MQSDSKTRTYIVTIEEQAKEEPIANIPSKYPTFAEMLTVIDGLRKCWMEKDICLTCLLDRLSEVIDKQSPGYNRLKVYMKNKVIENDIEIEKWAAEQVISILTIILSVFAGAIGLQADEISFLEYGWIIFVVFIIVVALCSAIIGICYERKLRERTKEKHFYEICLNILQDN